MTANDAAIGDDFGTYVAVDADTTIISAPFEIVFADLKMFDIADQVITGETLPASQALELTGLGLFYIAIYTLIAQLIFIDKEL